jgi:BirA family transcriptional regulator, biotin operon repressor / biotin---[acetyl-CoA-carboxylase] ligase
MPEAAPETPRILFFEDIDSTNAEARRRAEAGERGPLWITALRQHAGRGRRGRAWETGQGDNLAATCLFTTAMPPAQAAQVSFVAALAVADLIDAFSRDRASLKWPNDPLIAGRKAAGILVESGSMGEGRIWLAVGCGVNLARPPAQSDRPATALADHMDGPPPTPREALLFLVPAMQSWRKVWEASGFAPIAEAWTRRAHGLGGPCVAQLSNETFHGVAEGLDPDGALRLRLANGEVRRITAGDVFF